jgi:hypothetical protein
MMEGLEYGVKLDYGVAQTLAAQPRAGHDELAVQFVNRELWKDNYHRNNKSGGLKNMRCFPHCTDNHHRKTGFCGAPMQLLVLRPTAGDCPSASPPASPAGARESESEFFVWAEICPELERRAVGGKSDVKKGPALDVHVGAVVAQNVALSVERCAAHPFRPWIPGRVTMTIPNGARSVDLFEVHHDRRGWHYSFVANKHLSDLKHCVRAYVFVAEGAEHLRCVAVATSPSFTLTSRRVTDRAARSPCESNLSSFGSCSGGSTGPGSVGDGEEGGRCVGDEDEEGDDEECGSPQGPPSPSPVLGGLDRPLTSDELLPYVSPLGKRRASLSLPGPGGDGDVAMAARPAPDGSPSPFSAKAARALGQPATPELAGSFWKVMLKLLLVPQECFTKAMLQLANDNQSGKRAEVHLPLVRLVGGTSDVVRDGLIKLAAYLAEERELTQLVYHVTDHFGHMIGEDEERSHMGPEALAHVVGALWIKFESFLHMWGTSMADLVSFEGRWELTEPRIPIPEGPPFVYPAAMPEVRHFPPKNSHASSVVLDHMVGSWQRGQKMIDSVLRVYTTMQVPWVQRRTLGFQSERFSVIYDSVDDPDKITLCNQRKLFSSGILAYKFDKQFHGPLCISPLIYGQRLIKVYRAWYDDRDRTLTIEHYFSRRKMVHTLQLVDDNHIHEHMEICIGTDSAEHEFGVRWTILDQCDDLIYRIMV